MKRKSKELKVHYSFIWLWFYITVTSCFSQQVLENIAELKKIDVQEYSGDSISLDLSFSDEKNQAVRLGDYFNQGHPVVLTLAYYECPMLCTFVLNGLTKAVNGQPLLPGKDFTMLTVSIDPQEKPDLARAKKKNYVSGLTKTAGDSCWTFLVGGEQNIVMLAEQLGFIYYYDEKKDEYAHPAVVFVLTAKGVISRYLYGIDFKPQDLRLALLEAGEGKTGTTLDRLILYCYHYDPQSKGYVVFAGNVMRLGGVISVLVLAVILILLWKKELCSRN
jgi:protein SCO1